MVGSVREQIREAQHEMRDEDLSPVRANHLLCLLTALLANVYEEMRVAEAEYNGVLLVMLDSDEAANRAKIRAQVSPQYIRLRQAQHAEKEVTEAIRSLKVFIRGAAEEMKHLGVSR